MRSLRTFDLNLLPVLHDLLQTRNTTLTAKNMGLTQPAVSQALGRLRSHFDDPLLVRTGKKLEPTPFALTLLPQLETMITQTKQISFQTRTFDPLTSHYAFYLGMPEYMAFYAMPIITNYLKQHAPSCSVSVSNINRTHDYDEIFSNKTGLVLGNFPQRNGFFSYDLFEESFICLYKKNGKRKFITKKEYLEARHIRIGMNAFNPSLIDENLARFNKNRNIAISVPYYVLGYDLAQKRPDYILTAPKRLSLTFLKHFGLDWCPYPFQIPNQKIRMIWHPKYHQEPAYQWLRSALIDSFQ